ncbi:MAG: hypothetical protein C6P35_04405 [Cohnella sp.]|nr:MAG: hypothetical protein C6P35_04405 [Cohnella sp.]
MDGPSNCYKSNCSREKRKKSLAISFAQLFSRLRETNPARQSATVKSGMQAKPNKTARERSERGRTGTER